MKYSKWFAIGAALLLIAACFMPWTYHADVQKNFTGFFSEKNAYGKPGKFFVFFGTAFMIFSLVPKIWARRINLFIAAIMIAYAIKTYILFTSCYNAYCPDKKIGIYLVLVCNFLILLCAVFPTMDLGADKSAETADKPE